MGQVDHSAQVIQEALNQHRAISRFLKGCEQSKERNQPARLSVKLDSKEVVMHFPIEQIQQTIQIAKDELKAIEKKYGISPEPTPTPTPTPAPEQKPVAKTNSDAEQK